MNPEIDTAFIKDDDERPWLVKLLEKTQDALMEDKARLPIIQKMVDGEWHNLTSLCRVAKKKRPIGIVGVGMALNALQDSIGVEIFENGSPDKLEEDVQVESHWRIKGEYVGFMRVALSTLELRSTHVNNRNDLNRVLDRVSYKIHDLNGDDFNLDQ